jgi:hypothetical protein
MMKGSLKAFARKLTDWFAKLRFVPRNDKAENMSKAKFTYKTGQLGFIAFQGESFYFCLYHSVNQKINEI